MANYRNRWDRPGRPVGPTEGRGKRPWDPIRLSWQDRQILDYIANHWDEPRWQVAEQFGISLSRLSVLTCSPIGRAYMEKFHDRQ